MNRFREVRKAHERLEAAWNASAVRRSRDESAADDPTVASPETKRDDGCRPRPRSPTRSRRRATSRRSPRRRSTRRFRARARSTPSPRARSRTRAKDASLRVPGTTKKKTEPPGRSPRRFSRRAPGRRRPAALPTGRRSARRACGSSSRGPRARWSGWAAPRGGGERALYGPRERRRFRSDDDEDGPPRRSPIFTILGGATRPTTTTTTTTTTTGRRVVTGTTAGTTAVAFVPRRRGTRSTTS